MPHERRVIFSAPMVCAMLEGRKTQTRRLATSPLRKVQAGEFLVVRENFRLDVAYDALKPTACDPTAAIWFEADGRVMGAGCPGKLRPCIHMPRWGSRLTLKVVGVKVEPLQDISAADVEAEGAFFGRCSCGSMQAKPRTPMEAAFRQTWCHIHGPEFRHLWGELHTADGERWEGNPEVVAIEFTVHRDNIDNIINGEV